MRRKVLMGNWKMYKTVAEARAFAEDLGRLAASKPLATQHDYAVFAPFTSLYILPVMLPAAVKVGSQNIYHESQGAFTGEISASMVKELNVLYVLAGHSERRHIFGETDETIRLKVNAIVAAEMIPVICVGESLAERDGHQTLAVVERQTTQAIADLTENQVSTSLIAYEPVWAIGTGRTASAAQAEQVIAQIRHIVAREKGEVAAEAVRILYGGSVKPDNISSFVSQQNIDGALVGGASLEATSFLALASGLCADEGAETK